MKLKTSTQTHHKEILHLVKEKILQLMQILISYIDDITRKQSGVAVTCTPASLRTLVRIPLATIFLQQLQNTPQDLTTTVYPRRHSLKSESE